MGKEMNHGEMFGLSQEDSELFVVEIQKLANVLYKTLKEERDRVYEASRVLAAAESDMRYVGRKLGSVLRFLDEWCPMSHGSWFDEYGLENDAAAEVENV